MMTMKWYSGDSDLSHAYQVRRCVFQEEQQIPPAADVDGTDVDALHLVLYEEQEPLGTGRIYTGGGVYRLGRLAVLKQKRGQGLGEKLVRELIKKVAALGGNEVYLHAQEYLTGFYQRLGFRQNGSPFLEAGISHVPMVYQIAAEKSEK